jgi:predicted TIM-barrel fold metal-dependent hydrolase
MTRLGGIDGGIFVGRDEATGRDVDHVSQMSFLASMGAGRALAIAMRAVRYDWRDGNRRLLALTQQDPRLVPLATVSLPGYTQSDECLKRYRAEGFAAAALISDAMGWTLQSAAMKALAREAASAGMPLMLCAQAASDLASVRQVAEEGATVLLRWMRGHGYFRLADMIALGREYPNLMLEAGCQSQVGALALLADHLGDHRLFIASNDPQSHGAIGWFMLAAAELSHEAKSRIAGGNLARVLGLGTTAPYAEPESFVQLRAEEKIDTHWHTGSWNVIEPSGSFDDLRRLATVSGISTYLSSSIRALSDDLAEGNAETKALLDEDPRARGMIVINPRQIDASLAEISKYRSDARFVGLKTIQDFYDLSLDDESYRAIFARLRGTEDLPIMAHLRGMEMAARRFPHLQFVAAHSTWNYRDLAACPNVWFDISSSTPKVVEADIREMLRFVGAERILFSSDAPLIDPAWTLGKLVNSGLSANDFASVFRHNAQRAFARLRPDQASQVVSSDS